MASSTLDTANGPIHGRTLALIVNGYYTHTTKTGRRVAVSRATRRLLKARGLAA